MSRTLPALDLTKSPLVRVLCQIRYTPVLAIANYFPAIQDRLRLQGYPRVKKTLFKEAVFGPGGATTLEQHRWLVQNKAATNSVVITPDFVVLETSSYTKFDEFIEELATIAEVVAHEVQGLFVQRIGLRYVDLIRETPEMRWQDFLMSGLHGVTSDRLRRKTQVQLLQNVAETESGTMMVRVFQNREGRLLPPDLAEDELKLAMSPPIEKDELLTLIDLDHFSTRQEDYSGEYLTESAWGLHDDLDVLFRKSIVTKKALQTWE